MSESMQMDRGIELSAVGHHKLCTRSDIMSLLWVSLRLELPCSPFMPMMLGMADFISGYQYY